MLERDRDQGVNATRRDDQLRQAERQGLRDVEREVGAHRAADRDHAIDGIVRRELAREVCGADRHQWRIAEFSSPLDAIASIVVGGVATARLSCSGW